MKALKTTLAFCILALFVVNIDAYPEDDSHSGVTVFGTSKEAPSSEPSATEPYDGSYSTPGEIGDAGPMMIEIKGSTIGETAVSQAVVLPMKGVIMHVDTGVGHAFTIVRVDENGVETQVYDLDSPGQAVGKKLPAGTYKVYPDNIDGGLERGKMTTVVHVDCSEGMGEGL